MIAALVAVAAVVLVGQALIQPNQPLIAKASFSLAKITPNADGSDDVTLFSYHLARAARVSLFFEAADGTSYCFRKDEPRAPGDYEVAFSGVVDGYKRPGDHFAGEVLRRLIPDGSYTWHLVAAGDGGDQDTRTGSLVIADGDAPLPELQNFTVSPPSLYLTCMRTL